MVFVVVLFAVEIFLLALYSSLLLLYTVNINLINVFKKWFTSIKYSIFALYQYYNNYIKENNKGKNKFELEKDSPCCEIYSEKTSKNGRS